MGIFCCVEYPQAIQQPPARSANLSWQIASQSLIFQLATGMLSSLSVMRGMKDKMKCRRLERVTCLQKDHFADEFLHTFLTLNKLLNNMYFSMI